MRWAWTTRRSCRRFYKTIAVKESKRGWKMPFVPEKMRGMTPIGRSRRRQVGRGGGARPARRSRRASAPASWPRKASRRCCSADDLAGRYLAEDIVNLRDRRRSTARPATSSMPSCWQTLQESQDQGIPDPRHRPRHVGAFIRNTLNIDKNANHEEALMDIYRVMRPGEPPTLEAATNLFHGLFFDSERYDLSAVGRVKMNMRLDLEAPTTPCARCARRTSSPSSRRWSTCATARARSTTSTISATGACARWAS